MGPRGLAMVLLTCGQSHLSPLHQTLPAQDTVDPSTLRRRSPCGRWSMRPADGSSVPASPWLPSERRRLPEKAVCSTGACRLLHDPQVHVGSSASAIGSRCSWGLPAHRGPCAWAEETRLPCSAPPPSRSHSSADTVGALRHWNGRFFQPVRLQGQFADQMLELPVLPLELMNLLPGGIPHTVPGQSLLPGLHEFLGPRVVGVRLEALPPAQVTHRRLTAEPLQHDTNLLLGGVPASSNGLHGTDEGLGLLATLVCGQCFGCIWLGHICSFPGVLYPQSRSSHHLDLSALSIPSGVSFSLTAYSGRGIHKAGGRSGQGPGV